MGFSRAGKDGQPSKLTKERLQVFADAFGIREIDIHGKKHWSIDLKIDESSPCRNAVFDSESKS